MLVDDAKTIRVSSKELVSRLWEFSRLRHDIGHRRMVQVTVRFLNQEPTAPILYCELIPLTTLFLHEPCYRVLRNLRAAQLHDFSRELLVTWSDMETWTEHWIVTPD